MIRSQPILLLLLCCLLPAMAACGGSSGLSPGGVPSTAGTMSTAAPASAGVGAQAPAGGVATKAGGMTGMTGGDAQGVGQPAGTIKIVAPVAGQAVKAGLVKIKVEVTGVPEDQIHWHLSLDGAVAGMVSGLETDLALPAGDHTLLATLSSAQGHEGGPDQPHAELVVKVTP